MASDASNAKLPQAQQNLGIVPGVSAAAHGVVCDGATDTTAALQGAIGAASGTVLTLPAGMCRIACGTFTGMDTVSLQGAGRTRTTLQLAPACAQPARLFEWLSGSGAVVRDLTIDMNGATTVGNTTPLNFDCHSGFRVENVGIVNATGNMLLIKVGTSSACTVADFHITGNYLALTAPATGTANQCIAMSTAAGLGTITRGHITDNTCVNTALQVDGTYHKVTGNDISGFNFGTGIWNVPHTGKYNIFEGNSIHDSGLANDINGTPAAGVELTGDYSTFRGNICTNLGGSCVTVFGNYNLVEGNVSTNVSLTGTPTPRAQGAYRVVSNTLAAPPVIPTGNRFSGNIDHGGPSQLYSYYEQDANAVDTTLRGNKFKGATVQAYKILSPTTEADWNVIETKYGTNVANLTWAGVDYGSYKRFQLDCPSLAPTSVASTLTVLLGQSGSLLRSGYAYAGTRVIANAATVTGFNSTTAAAIQVSDSVLAGNAILTVELGTLEGALARRLTFRGSSATAGIMTSYQGGGQFTGNTNPIDMIAVEYAGQNLTGNCVLSGKP